MSDKPATPSPADRPLFGVLPDGTPLQIPIIGLCGGYGSGKTLAGLTICPEETIEIGVEDSGVTYNLPIKHRFSMYKEVTGKSGSIPKPIECWEWFTGIVERISKGELKCRVLFIDPITDLQNGMVEWVKAHGGKSSAQYEKASGLLWGDTQSYAKLLLGKLSSKCTLAFTAHMGSVWSGGAPVAGKKKAKGINTFYELASLYVYLTREVNPQTGTQPDKPVGHICPPHGKSRLAHMVQDAQGNWLSKPILPPRIPEFTWAEVRKYVAKPPEYDKLKKDEKAEIETLSEEDRLLLENQTALAKLEEAQIQERLIESAKAAGARAKMGTSVVSRAMGEKPAEKPDASADAKPAATAAPAPASASTPAEPKKEEPKKQEEKSATPPDALAPPELQPWTREKCLSILAQQFVDAKFSPEQIKASCARRGADAPEGLTDEKLEDLRRGMWSYLTKKEMEQKSGKAPIPKKS